MCNDMLGERVDVFFGNMAGAFAFYLSGQLKVLAVTDKARAPAIPDCRPAPRSVPPAFSRASGTRWSDRPTQAELRVQIAKATIEVLKMPDVQQRFRALDVERDGRTPAERPPSSRTKPCAGAR